MGQELGIDLALWCRLRLSHDAAIQVWVQAAVTSRLHWCWTVSSQVPSRGLELQVLTGYELETSGPHHMAAGFFPRARDGGMEGGEGDVPRQIQIQTPLRGRELHKVVNTKRQASLGAVLQAPYHNIQVWELLLRISPQHTATEVTF